MLLYKEDEKWVCIIIIYIDGMLIIGKEEAIDDTIKVLQGHFKVKHPMNLEDDLHVHIVQSDDGKKARVWRNNLERELQRRKCLLHQEHQGLLVERWMIFQRWMRKHNPCTGQGWEHCCISPSTVDLISQILSESYPRVWIVPPWHMSQRCTG